MSPLSDAQLAKQCEARVGSSLKGKWRLDKLIGTGAMAAVYRATHKIGRVDAIKILHPHAAKSPELRRRFELEAAAANHFDHEGAVKVHDSDVSEDGCPFLVMELLEGETLGERATRLGGLPVPELLRFTEELLDVLAAAHAASVIHRDIKLENLFVTKTERLKVLDFGIARVRSSQAITVAGARLGTVAYMSPEQVRGQEIDARADLFSVGATMFRVLAKRRIHEAASEADLLISMGTKPAPKISTLVEDLDPRVAMVVDRALEFRADARYPDAATMRDDVKAVRAGQPPPYAVGRFRQAAQEAALRGAPTVAKPPVAASAVSVAAPAAASSPTIAAPMQASQVPAPKPSQPGLGGTMAMTPAMIAASRSPAQTEMMRTPPPPSAFAGPVSARPSFGSPLPGTAPPLDVGPASVAPRSFGPAPSMRGPSSFAPSSAQPVPSSLTPAPSSAQPVPSSLTPATYGGPHSSGRPPPAPTVLVPAGSTATPLPVASVRAYQPVTPIAVVTPTRPTSAKRSFPWVAVVAVGALAIGAVGAFVVLSPRRAETVVAASATEDEAAPKKASSSRAAAAPTSSVQAAPAATSAPAPTSNPAASTSAAAPLLVPQAVIPQAPAKLPQATATATNPLRVPIVPR